MGCARLDFEPVKFPGAPIPRHMFRQDAMSTTPADGMRHLRRIAATLQQARTSRRALLKGTAALTAIPALGTTPARAAPDQPPVRDLVVAQGVAAGACLVTSRRLPLAGIAADQPAPLLQGDLTDWSELGLGASLPVTVLVVDPHFPEGVTPAETLADYAALVAALDRTPGGVAMLPLELVDARVQVLDLDGVSPLLATGTADAPIVRIGVAGDIIFGRKGGNRQRDYESPTLPVHQVMDFMATFDLTVANFECFVSETLDLPELTQTNPLDFVTRPDSLEGMVMAGIDSVTMANNHAVYPLRGYGMPMNDTIGFLNEAGIPAVGRRREHRRSAGPVDDRDQWHLDRLLRDRRRHGQCRLPGQHGAASRTNPESMPGRNRGGTNPLSHGPESSPTSRHLPGSTISCCPTCTWVTSTSGPRATGWSTSRRQFVDAGATAVLTSHPHATMGMEIYQGKPIFYSIGNFIYDQMFSLETREGYFLELTFRGKEADRVPDSPDRGGGLRAAAVPVAAGDGRVQRPVLAVDRPDPRPVRRLELATAHARTMTLPPSATTSNSRLRRRNWTSTPGTRSTTVDIGEDDRRGPGDDIDPVDTRPQGQHHLRPALLPVDSQLPDRRNSAGETVPARRQRRAPPRWPRWRARRRASVRMRGLRDRFFESGGRFGRGFHEVRLRTAGREPFGILTCRDLRCHGSVPSFIARSIPCPHVRAFGIGWGNQPRRYPAAGRRPGCQSVTPRAPGTASLAACPGPMSPSRTSTMPGSGSCLTCTAHHYWAATPSAG